MDIRIAQYCELFQYFTSLEAIHIPQKYEFIAMKWAHLVAASQVFTKKQQIAAGFFSP